METTMTTFFSVEMGFWPIARIIDMSHWPLTPLNTIEWSYPLVAVFSFRLF
jgi:hypothetical protein